jgi:hypothetical protein
MAKFQWLDDESNLHEMVYGELDTHLRDLFTQVRLLDGGGTLLRFMQAHANTLSTVDDIAYHLAAPAPAVEKSLRTLVKLGLVRHIDAADITLYGITNDPDRRRLVRDLCAWQDRWHTRLTQIERAIEGKFSPSSV